MHRARTAVPRPIPILRYLGVHPSPTHPSHGVDAALFGDQLDILLAHGYIPLRVPDLVTAMTLDAPVPSRSVVITFDQGLRSFSEYALPALRRRDVPATVFVATAFVGRRSRVLRHVTPDERAALTWTQLREAIDEDVSIGSNGHSHRPLDTMSRWEAGEDMALSRALLEHQLQRTVDTIAYPDGLHTSGTRAAAARVGFVAGATLRGAVSSNYDDPFALTRVPVHGSTRPEVLLARLTLAGRRPSHGEPLRERLQRTARRIAAFGGTDPLPARSADTGSIRRFD